MIDVTYSRQDGETEDHLIYRVYSDRENGKNNFTCDEAGQVLNQLTGNEYTESRYRKKYQSFKDIFIEIKDSLLAPEDSASLRKQQEDLMKLKTQNSDWHKSITSVLRYEARVDELVSAVRENATRFPNIACKFEGQMGGDKEAVLLLGDFHIGSIVRNFANKYDYDIAVKRLEKLLSHVVKYCRINNVKKLHVLGLGDFIEGIIHVNGRVAAEMNVVDQTMTAAALIYTTLTQLSAQIEEVDYRQCLDNHSRIIKNYDEHVEEESFGKLIAWWLREKLSHTPVKFYEDNLDENIGSITIGKKEFAFVHGHLENRKTVLQDLVFGTGHMFAGVFLGHWHSSKRKEFQGKKVYFNGSLMGVDDYAKDIRKFSDPSQTLIIFDDNNEIEIPINLK